MARKLTPEQKAAAEKAAAEKAAAEKADSFIVVRVDSVSGEKVETVVTPNPKIPNAMIAGHSIPMSVIIEAANGVESDAISQDAAIQFLGKLVQVKSPSITWS